MSELIKIAIDAMGGDNSPKKIIDGIIHNHKSNKENFFKLLELMNYKRKKINENKEEFFIYQPKYVKNKKGPQTKKIDKDKPFSKLSELRLR